MNHVYLERHEPNKNMHRFYQFFIMPGLFDDWSLVREWGRIGSPGTVKKDWFVTEEDVVVARDSMIEKKLKKGYIIK